MSQVAAKDRRRLFDAYAKGCESESTTFVESLASPSRQARGMNRWCSTGSYAATKYVWYLNARPKLKNARQGDRFDRLATVARKVAANYKPKPEVSKWIELFAAEQEFEELADRWERETRNMSSPNAMERHPAYREIIAIGKRFADLIIPLILQRLVAYPSFWFQSLLEISGEPKDPILPEMLGDVPAMCAAWLKWGEQHGYIKLD